MCLKLCQRQWSFAWQELFALESTLEGHYIDVFWTGEYQLIFSWFWRKGVFDEISHCFILECQRGFFKDSVSNAKCVPCPANSASDIRRTGCTCKEGYYRSSSMADCEGIFTSVWSCPNHYRLIKVLKPIEDHFEFVRSNFKMLKGTKGSRVCCVLLNV